MPLSFQRLSPHTKIWMTTCFLSVILVLLYVLLYTAEPSPNSHALLSQFCNGKKIVQRKTYCFKENEILGKGIDRQYSVVVRMPYAELIERIRPLLSANKYREESGIVAFGGSFYMNDQRESFLIHPAKRDSAFDSKEYTQILVAYRSSKINALAFDHFGFCSE